MLGFSRGGVVPFGWSVTCAGRAPLQVRDEVRALADWTERAWEAHFPGERGYTIELQRPSQTGAQAHTGACAQLVATRGDFTAFVSIEHVADHDVDIASRRGPELLRVRMFGRAACGSIMEAEESAMRSVAFGRAIGAAVGLLLFGGLCWLSLGVSDPIFVLGGLLMVVALVTTTFAGATLGAWFGERLGDRRRRRARENAERDPGMHSDLERWKALTRHLLAQRAGFLGGRKGQPFRRFSASSSWSSF